MGHSVTINVIGFSKEEEIDEKTCQRAECHAMNKMEMAQEVAKMANNNTPVVGWFAQTKTGCKMLSGYLDATPWEEVPNGKVKHVSLVTCPICNGKSLKDTRKIKPHCPICRNSGITRRGYETGWRQWQLDEMIKDYA